MRRNNNDKQVCRLHDNQECPVCGNKIGIVAGSKDAICNNCGFKDPCCE